MSESRDIVTSLRSMFWPADLHPAARVFQCFLMLSGVVSISSFSDDAAKFGGLMTSAIGAYRQVVGHLYGLVGAAPSATTLDVTFLVLLAFVAANLGYYRETGKLFVLEFLKTILAFLFFIPIMMLQALRDLTRDSRPGRLAARVIVASRGLVKTYSLDAVSERVFKLGLRALDDDPFSALVFMLSMIVLGVLALAATLDVAGVLPALGIDFGPSTFFPSLRTISGWFFTYCYAWFAFFASGGIFALRWVVGTVTAFCAFYAVSWIITGLTA